MNDGGPAFPIIHLSFKLPEHFGQQVTQEGMSLRDWFAGQALADILSSMNWTDEHIDKSAKLAYKIADAMLKERKKGGN